MTCMMALAYDPQPYFLETLRSGSQDNCVFVEYEFSTEMAGFKAVGDGSLEIQGTSYHMTGNGVEIYCDGTSTWVIDEDASEVVIEAADSRDSGFLANPVILLMNLEESGLTYKESSDHIYINLEDGTELDIRIKAMSVAPIKKPEAFRPPTDFSDKWIVTDLR